MMKVPSLWYLPGKLASIARISAHSRFMPVSTAWSSQVETSPTGPGKVSRVKLSALWGKSACAGGAGLMGSAARWSFKTSALDPDSASIAARWATWASGFDLKNVKSRVSNFLPRSP